VAVGSTGREPHRRVDGDFIPGVGGEGTNVGRCVQARVIGARAIVHAAAVVKGVLIGVDIERLPMIWIILPLPGSAYIALAVFNPPD